MTASPYPAHIDCVWIASDCDGYLAAFITAGIAPIPVSVLDGRFMDNDDIERSFYDLPRISQSHVHVTAPRPDSYVEIAERGFYAYDWLDIHWSTRHEKHVYERVATPFHPVHLTDITGPLLDYVQAVRLARLSFVNVHTIDIQQHLPSTAS